MEAFQKQLPGSTESEFPFAGHGSDFHAHKIEQIQRLLAKLFQSPNIHSTTYEIKTVITSGQVTEYPPPLLICHEIKECVLASI